MSNVSNHNNDLLIPEGVTFVGSIHVPGFAQINGDVHAQGIQVHGKLENDITCKGLLKIHKTGKVSGKLSYLEIDIDRGGQFVGDMSSTK